MRVNSFRKQSSTINIFLLLANLTGKKVLFKFI